MKHKKAFLYGIIPVAAAGLAAAGIASAHGMGGFSMGMGTLTSEEGATRQTQMFASQAQMLGISEADVKAAWASGKNMQDLMAEKGIKKEDVQARMKTAAEAKMKAHLQALVAKGVITQAQADSRLAFMQSHMEKGGGKARMMRGMGQGMHAFDF